MRRQLLLTLALALLGAAVGAGIGNASGGSNLLDTGGAGVSVDLGGGGGGGGTGDLTSGGGTGGLTGGGGGGGTGTLSTVTTLPACSNLQDDDGDGLTDLADPGCSGPTDGDEYNPPPSTGGGGGGGGGGTGGGGGGYVPPPTGGTSPHHGGGHHGGGGHEGGTSAQHQQSGSPMNPPDYKPDGTPTPSNPSFTLATPNPAPLGVPNFLIDQFSIPPFLLPIYQACGTQYGIPWQVLAGINRIETAFGTNLNVSTAGAVGWMQFIPSTWKAYGVDANGDGRKDPYNPVDAICAAARYLRAAGGDTDIRQGIFAYNHADWYVDEVLLYANQYGKLPEDLIGSLTGLTEGDRFPVAARARYADDLSAREATKRAEPSKTGATGNVADVVSSSPTRRGINIYSREGAPVVAVNDGTIAKIGHDAKKGDYIVLRDTFGNRFTYAQLGRVSKVYAVPKQKHDLSAHDFKLVTPKREKAPDQPASAGLAHPVSLKDGGSNEGESKNSGSKGGDAKSGSSKKGGSKKTGPNGPAAFYRAHDLKASAGPSSTTNGPVNTENSRRRLYAYPDRPHNLDRDGLTGQLDKLLHKRFPGYETVKNYLGDVLHLDRRNTTVKPLREGSHVVAGTVLARVGKTDELAPHLNFSIRPAGRGAPKIDPKPILDGWKLLEATAIYRAAGENPFQSTGSNVTQDLLLSKTQLERKVLGDPRLSIYACGRTDIRTGQIDQRILAAMEYLANNGFRLTITSLKCGHSTLTTSGNVSEHTTGDAMDIAEVNEIPILGNQGPGSITEAVIKSLLELQGPMVPHQIISLMDLGGPSFVLPDHDDHIHVGYYPEGNAEAPAQAGKQFQSMLKPDQWQDLIGQIADIDNPKVPTHPSKFATPTHKGHSHGSKRKPFVGD